MDGRRTLGDRYELDSTLGRGGMATVYRGRDLVLDRPVAIKVLAERYAGDERFVTRFRREARAAAGLSHGNIVSVFDTGDTDGEHFIVMELVEGETLGDLLRREGPLSADRAVRIAASIARALQAAHDRGLVHRDVKPGNVMLTPAAEVKVMDFGIARAVTDDKLTQTGIVLGTASYLSPEQSQGDPVDHRSDVYALGCVLYEMLTGQPPFSGSAVSVAYKHVNDRPDPPSRVNPSVPAEVETVVMRALEKDPDARFHTAEAFRQALAAAVEGETTEPLGIDTAPERTEPIEPAAPRRMGWIAFLAILGVALAAVIAAVALTGGEPGRRGGDDRERGTQASPARPTPTASEVPGVTGTAAQLAEQLDVAVGAGLITADAAEKTLQEIEKAVEEFEEGDQEKALEHLAKADEEIDAALAAGSIAVPQMAQSLHDAINDLRLAMGGEAVEPSPTKGDEEEDSGPGNSENAPGQKKKDHDD